MQIIKCVIKGQKLNIAIPTMVDLTVNYFNVQANFSSEWDGMGIFCHIFKSNDPTIGGDFAVIDGAITSENGINLDNGEWNIWFSGTLEDNGEVTQRITTETRKFNVLTTGTEDWSMPEIETSVAEQIMAVATSAYQKAVSVEERANSGEFDGEQGETGPYFTPNVSEEGVISWTNNGGLPNPESRNITGPAGAQGPAGMISNITATIGIGTGDPSVNVKILPQSTPSDVQFCLEFDGLKGEKGPKGDPGKDADGETYTEKSGVGNDLTVNSPATGLPIRELLLNVYPTQSGEGVPSPTNVRTLGPKSLSSLNYSGDNREVYNTISYNVLSIAGTCYGCAIDVLKGTLTVMTAIAQIKDFQWQWSRNYTRFQTTAPIAKPNRTQTYTPDWLFCECYVAGPPRQDLMEFNQVSLTNNGTMLIKDSRFTQQTELVSDFLAAVGDYYVVYPLAEPIVYSVPKYDISLISGQNSYWSDNSVININYGDYAVAVKEYALRMLDEVKSSIAPVESGSTAKNNYSTGDYFYLGNVFCVAKTSISQGETFTLNTNYEVTTVSAIIKSLQ